MAAMTRYFFHVVSESGVHTDENGQVFSGLKDAKDRASRIAQELTQGGSYVGSVCIADEHGNELDRVTIGAEPVVML
jgi:hypothetical protein